MKKKLATTLSVVLILGLAVLGILAYLTDTDSDVNVMTLGEVDIEQEEVFDEDNADLYPGTEVEKKVTVKNVGKSDAYVRTWFAFEAPMDHITPEWIEGVNPVKYEGESEIDGQNYVIYSVTYDSALVNGAEVGSLLSVAMDTDATNEDMVALGDDQEYKVLVYSQAVQTEGFNNAAEALTAAFGDIHPWQISIPADAVAVSDFEGLTNALAEGGNYEIVAPFTVEGTLTVSADTNLYNANSENVITFAQNARIETAENVDLGLYGVKIDGGGSYEVTEDSFTRDGNKTINNDAILKAFAGSTLTLGEGTVVENVVSTAPAVAWAKGTVDNRATIILEGATIQNCAGGSGTVINVDRYGDVYIEEGTVISNNVSSNGNHGIIRIYNDNWDAANASTLNVNGGEIRDNYFSGNGMIGLYYAKMNMNGGKISNNAWLKATATGNGFYCLVYVHSNSQFIMNGGEISGNTITDGVINAINSEVVGAITFNGGTVTNNSNTRNENKDALAAVCYPGAVATTTGTEKVLVISDKANVTGTIYSHANLNNQVDKKYIDLSEFLGK